MVLLNIELLILAAMKEIWKDVIGYEGIYQVSNLGRVKSIQKWRGTNFRILSDRFNCHGYNTVVLYKDKKSKQFTVHQLMAIVFLGHNPCGMSIQVDHIDNDRKNNKLTNLQILTDKEHIKKTYKNLKSSSKYTGVSWDKINNKWRASISKNKKVYNLGRFETEEEAWEARRCGELWLSY